MCHRIRKNSACWAKIPRIRVTQWPDLASVVTGERIRKEKPMALSFKGKGKKIAISLAVVLVLMLIGGGLTGWLLGSPWPRNVLIGISAGYSVWLSTVLAQDAAKKG